MTSFAEVLQRARRAPSRRRSLSQERSLSDAVSAGFVRLAAEHPWPATPLVSSPLPERVEAPVPDALRALGLGPEATVADVRRAFRRHALRAHPDRGGSAEAFRRLLASYEEALALTAG